MIGKDENSNKLTAMIDDERISSILESNSFVAITIHSDSQEYVQFAKICK